MAIPLNPKESSHTFKSHWSEKTVLIGIEVVNAQLDYNLLLEISYMYAIRVIASTVFRFMMFPHEGKIMMIDQLTYHDPQEMTTPANVIP